VSAARFAVGAAPGETRLWLDPWLAINDPALWGARGEGKSTRQIFDLPFP